MAELKAYKMIPHSAEKGTQAVYEMDELIRCKDCKHWDADEHECNIKIGWFACGADWYCADGEKK